MTTDSIAEVGIDEQERLYVRPSTATFPYIYREAVEVHWEAQRRYLYSPKPREWTYVEWFQHIIGAAALQSCELRLTPSTAWHNVPPELSAEMKRWFSFGKHLTALDAPLAAWAEARGFTRHDNTGSYPERRYYRHDTSPHVFLSVLLQRKDSGPRFEEFSPDLPYCACLGFFLPRPDKRSKRIILFHHVPFERLERDLISLLEPADAYLRDTRTEDLLDQPDPYHLYYFDHATQSGFLTEGIKWL